MSVKTKEDFLASLKSIVGENTTDEVLTLLEDAEDTFNDFNEKINNNENENWKQKYEENDAQWRERYRARFFSPIEDAKEKDEEDVFEYHEHNIPQKFEELFTKGV